jgi:hypothetical protein
MGYNTVAVLYNDFTAEIAKSGQIGTRIADAMRRYSSRREGQFATNFGAGMVISQAHADCEQVVIVSRNYGVRADEATNLGPGALNDMAECLERHGYKVTAPKRKCGQQRKSGQCPA